ncbi:MAG: thymidine phosphorylase, partial [Verrucomicrobiota bacterium]
IMEFLAAEGGVISKVDADSVGRASLALGAGRAAAGDDVDHVVGFDRIVKIGESVSVGDLVARVHARDDAAAKVASDQFLEALETE